MAKQAVSSAGVQAKVNELYALPKADRITQAGLIRSDFRTWISDNFLLDTAQAVYLSRIDPAFIQQAGSSTATAVTFELTVTLNIPAVPPPVFSSKYFVLANNLVQKYDSVAGYSVTGSLQYNIGYTV